MIASIFTYFITGLFIALWAYAAFPKFLNLKYFREVLLSQAIPNWMGNILTVLLPVLQIGVIVLLILPNTRLIGMYLSFFMMLVFTLYIGGIVFKLYKSYPCPCGGLFTRLGWNKHFKVNIILTALAFIGIILIQNGAT